MMIGLYVEPPSVLLGLFGFLGLVGWLGFFELIDEL
jgi:hypothetical protein